MILMYYAIERNNNGVRISCIVFLILVWLCCLIPTFIHLRRVKNILKSDSSFMTKLKSISYFLLTKLYFVIRVVIYLGYFPCIVLFNQDKEKFEREFGDTKYYLISATDAGSFIVTLLHV